MTLSIIVLIIVGGLAYLWAGGHGLDVSGSCLMAIIVGLFWALIAFFAVMS